MPALRRAPLALLALSLGCSTFGAVYPPRPPAEAGAAIADPDPSRVVVHATITAAGLQRAIDEALPPGGEGTFSLGGARRYTWKRSPVAVRFTQGRVGVDLHVTARVDLPLGGVDVPFDASVTAEPVLTSEYVARLQSAEVKVTSEDRVTRLADAAAGVLETIRKELAAKIDAFAYDARPDVERAYQKLTTPIDLPLGDAKGCASLRVLGVEAGPTVLAGGIEKDLALVIAPSVTLPCAAEGPPPSLPPLANVASIQPGPFTVTLAVAARYEELTAAMGLAFTNGKYFFSKEYPEIYMEKPEVYASGGKLVLKLGIKGPVHKLGFNTTLDGDLFLTGTPLVVDNELEVPDLEPTLETRSFLLSLKAAADVDAIRAQARAALRLDLSQRLAAVKDKLSADLSMGGPVGCLRSEVSKIQVTGVHAHAAYLRVQAAVTGKASAYVPCPE